MRARLLTAATLIAACLKAPPEATQPDDSICGTAGALVDTFDQEVVALDTWRWSSTGDVASVSEGVRIVATAAENSSALQSAAYYAVAGSELVAQLELAQANDAFVSMELENPSGHQVGVRLRNGLVGLHVADADGNRMHGAEPYDPDRSWWRLSERDGQFYFATATDQGDWKEQGPFEVDIGNVARVDFDLVRQTIDSQVIVRSVNPESTVGYCPASSFTDEFENPNRRWQVDEQGDCAVEVAGDLRLGYSAQAFCAASTRERFDFEGSAFSVELADVGNCQPKPVMRVTLPDGQELEVQCRDQEGLLVLSAQNPNGVGDFAELGYEPSAHRFVQLRHDLESNSIVVEAGKGDGVWEPVGTWPPTPGDLSSVSLRFYLGGDTDGGEFESVILDSLNVVP